ncbi:MAG: DivIVA domain-containing protein [Bowdeniella nasicola]|nr:DivIVA domain-containing protein [Bowdeniella nasicola]
MALLSADDVLNKKFSQTKFREGYDQEEVDDFLDEVVATLRAVTSENEELKAKLAAAERRISELGQGGFAPAGSDDAVESPEPEAPAVEAEPAEPQAPATPVESFAPATEAPVTTGESDPAQSATGMLALAQRLHDEYVRNGQDEGERIVAEAKQRGETIVKDAEEKYNNTLAQLEKERSLLEHKIDELRSFERDYRSRLKSYLENLLDEVQTSSDALN